MSKPYSMDLRERVVGSVEEEGLSRRQAALLATVLPSPRKRSAAKPTQAQARHAITIQRRIGQIRPLLDCYAGGTG